MGFSWRNKIRVETGNSRGWTNFYGYTFKQGPHRNRNPGAVNCKVHFLFNWLIMTWYARPMSCSALLSRAVFPYQKSVCWLYARRRWKDCQSQDMFWLASQSFNSSCKSEIYGLLQIWWFTPGFKIWDFLLLDRLSWQDYGAPSTPLRQVVPVYSLLIAGWPNLTWLYRHSRVLGY